MRSSRFRAGLTGLVLVGLLLLPGVALALPVLEGSSGGLVQAVTSASSTNWAGYIAGGGTGTVTKASASWTEPAIKCGSTTQYAVFWVGIDGAISPSATVEQVGTIAICSGGSASYGAWWEFYPLNDIQVIAGFAVHPGDKISASVSYASSKFTLSIKDGSQSFAEKGTQAGVVRNSAECIVERPAEDNGGVISLLQLADFKTVAFSSCKATIGGTAGGIGSFSTVYAVTMVSSSSSGHTLASVSVLSSTKSGFTATWVKSH